MVRSTRSRPTVTSPCHAPSGKIVVRGTQSTSSPSKGTARRRCFVAVAVAPGVDLKVVEFYGCPRPGRDGTGVRHH